MRVCGCEGRDGPVFKCWRCRFSGEVVNDRMWLCIGIDLRYLLLGEDQGKMGQGLKDILRKRPPQSEAD